MAIYTIKSNADASGQRTQLDLDDGPLRLDFRVIGQSQPAISASLAAVPFLIRLRRYDLANQRMFWNYMQYAASGRPRISGVPDQQIVLEYTATATLVQEPVPPEGLPPGVQLLAGVTLDPITVTLTLSTAVRNLNFGWINFDFGHTYPSQIAASDPVFAWESTIHYPFLDFTVAGQNAGALTPVTPWAMKFASAYLHETTPAGVNVARGVAIHLEDVNGHETGAWYDTAHNQLNFELRNSIHLKGRTFVRAPDYTLSHGDAFGYGGNAMVYRVRAFNIQGAVAGAPVDWRDVLDLYRTWLRTRFSIPDEPSMFYKKLPSAAARAKNAPVDQMAPHTVISNYSLDGAVDPSDDATLAGWLEMHPLRDGAPDTPGAVGNATFMKILRQLQANFGNPADLKLEVQAWGVEKAGFYQFICGWPPLTNVLTGDGSKFGNGVAALAGMRAALSITTDPLNTIFNRGRYAGHIRLKAGAPWSGVQNQANWDALITKKMPANVRASTCAVTSTKVSGKQFDRIWVVESFPAIEGVPASPHTPRFKAAQKKNEWGQLLQDLPVLGSGLYRATQKQICPTADIASLYLNEWVTPWIINQRVRVLEFMKHHYSKYFCYSADHQHIVAHPHVPQQTNPAYDNVIGHGSWYVRRMQCILFDVHELGKAMDGDPFCTFRVAHEFQPPELLAGYLDEYYSGSEELDFVYSHLVTQHQTPGRGGWGIHPGYKEARQVPGGNLISLDWMLSSDRDTPDRPPLHPSTSPARINSFNEWRDKCTEHFKTHFRVEQWGTAPRGYPTTEEPGPVAWNPADPLAPTVPPTYTYNRCVQQSFNLRANIFATGEAAVRGMRIMIPSHWLEEPYDYDNEAVEHAVRACRMQMQAEWKEVFRSGRMLGETLVTLAAGVKTEIWAWGDGINVVRSFKDVKPLYDQIALDDPYAGTGWHSKPLSDFISRPWDKLTYVDRDADANHQPYNETVLTKRIHHRIWQLGDGSTRKVVYLFANVSNTDTNVSFLYTRGLDATPWRRTIYYFTPNAIAPASGTATLGQTQTFMLPARSFAAVLVQK